MLAGLPFREIGISAAMRARGDTALLAGSGGWCRPYQEIMPGLLGHLEDRFRKIVVLPSSFDTTVPRVRDALAATKAVVFARERESYRQIRDLCRAEIAPDMAFFVDFSPYAGAGSGRLDCFRTDPESSRRFPLPPENDDLSARCESLDEWLRQIARYAEVRTDRAHVMIAAALLGKKVRYAPSSYHKLPAIAEYSLADFDVSPIALPEAATPRARAPEPGRALAKRMRAFAQRGEAASGSGDFEEGPPRVTIVILSWNRLERTEAAIRSVEEFVRVPHRLLVVDNGSDAPVPARLGELRRAGPGFDLVLLERNLGCSGGRKLALERVATEFVVFLDNDVEVFPGSVERLVRDLESHPEALAVGASVVLPDGKVQWCGGDYSESEGDLKYRLLGEGLEFDDPAVGPSGPCGWVAGGATAYRTSAFAEQPLDPAMSAYFEDIEWCYRVNRSGPPRFRRRSDALVLHRSAPKMPAQPDFLHSLPYVEAIARFYSLHGLVLEGLYGFVQELVDCEGVRNRAAARLLLELVAARGADWTMLQFLGGGLAPLFDGWLDAAGKSARLQLADIHGSRVWRAAQAYWALRRSVRRIFG